MHNERSGLPQQGEAASAKLGSGAGLSATPWAQHWGMMITSISQNDCAAWWLLLVAPHIPNPQSERGPLNS
jgi:hypothetical protein